MTYHSKMRAKEEMRGTGFEPAQALSHRILSPVRLTTPTPSPEILNRNLLLKLLLTFTSSSL